MPSFMAATVSISATPRLLLLHPNQSYAGRMTFSSAVREQDLSAVIVAIGASGSEGLGDIKALLAALPIDLKAIVLVVLHRPSDQISELKEVLARVSQMPVLIAGGDERFRAGHCYIGEPDAHLSLAANSHVQLIEGKDHRHRNRSVDILFNSVAAHAKKRAIGVVLSGSLDDGSRGLEAIAHAGGTTMVLTRAGIAERGMPKSAAEFDGPIDVLGPAATIAREIEQCVREMAQ
jgi:two-component system chemotaxis response regulator CheB